MHLGTIRLGSTLIESLAADAPDTDAGMIGILAIGSSSIVNNIGNCDNGSEGAEGLNDPSMLVV